MMAAHGSAPTERANHVCWMYEDVAEFRQRANAFLAEGLVAGNRLVYLSRSDAVGVNDLGPPLQTLAEPQRLIDRGDLVLGRTEEVYGCRDAVDPRATREAYVRATRQALAHGYTGMRVVADGSDLLRTPAQQQDVAKYEFLIDRHAAAEPFFAMCGYDAARLDRRVAAQLACLHPRTQPDGTAFRWHAASHADVALVGEIDYASAEVFELTLERTLPLLGRLRVDVDAADLAFIDHRGLLALERHARRTDTDVMLRNAPFGVQRLTHLLDLRAVQPQ